MMNESDLAGLSTLTLAHVGDGVYELLTRTYLAKRGDNAVARIHKDTVARVCAPAQAKAAEKLLPHLTETELAIYKRGRNARVNSVPKAASQSQYHASTALETLFGWLWLREERDRIAELFAIITEDD